MHYRVEPTYRDDWLVIPPEAYTHEARSIHAWPMLAFDCLYNHFQIEKFAGAFLFCSYALVSSAAKC